MRSRRDYVGFILGMCSVLCWVVAQAPQLYENYKTKSAEALSPYFLAEWLLGDTSNLLGALLKGDQPQTVVFTAQYFVCMDCILLIQYLYYTSMAKRRERIYTMSRKRYHRHRHHHHRQEDGVDVHVTPTPDGQQGGSAARSGIPVTGQQALGMLGVMGMMTLMISVSSNGMGREYLGRRPREWPVNESEIGDYRQFAGTIIGYLSCTLYLVSRGSQIHKNWKRKSTEGLAVSMFAFACAANLFYGASVILRSANIDEFMSSLPWLIGSLGTVVLDFIILIQSTVWYRHVGEPVLETDQMTHRLLEEGLQH